MQFYIGFVPEDFERVYKATFKVKNKIDHLFVRNGGMVNRKCAIQYAGAVISNLMGQKYFSSWHPYSPRYRKWKYEVAKYPSDRRFWQLGMDLVRNITHFRNESGGHKGWMGGIPPRVKDAGGKSWFGPGKRGGRKGRPKLIAFYGYIIEWGGGSPGGRGGHHLPRHLFLPTMGEFVPRWEKNIYAASVEVADQWR